MKKATLSLLLVAIFINCSLFTLTADASTNTTTPSFTTTELLSTTNTTSVINTQLENPKDEHMTKKDWLLLIIPIVANLVVDGFLVVVLQKIIVDKYIKRRSLKDEIVKAFMDKLKDFSNCFIQANFDAMTDGDTVNKNILVMQSHMVELSKYYNTNVYDLRQFKMQFDALTNHWMTFQTALNTYARQPDFTASMRLDLGQKIQLVFDSLSELLECVRKKY